MKNRAKGFTIIEVLIVLAIAGLIILILFLAVPAMTRVQRDNRRKQDLGKLYSAVREYQINSGKTMNPFNNASSDAAKFEKFIDDYLGPEYDQYEIVLHDSTASHSFPHVVDQIVYFPQHFCSEDTTLELVSGTGPHPPYAWAVLIGLESGERYYCLDQGNKGA